MNSLLIVALILSVVGANARSEIEYKNAFSNWITKFQKAYKDIEFELRYQSFRANLDYVEAWNAAHDDIELEMNQYADLSNAEFNRIYLGVSYSYEESMFKPKNIAPLSAESLPASVDWRNSNAVTAIKNQGQCGSCWSFSSTGSMEGAWKIAGNTLTSLSEQNLMDCSTSYGNAGCDGGLMDYAFQYVIKNGGIDTEASYPYTAVNGPKCKYNVANKGASISSYHDIPTGNETALAAAIANVGPVSVAIDASRPSFQLYKSGVYYDIFCSSTKLDHGVLAVGYGTDGSHDYYIVKNSWGPAWGQEGYIWMARNRNNNCGIATSASYPIV